MKTSNHLTLAALFALMMPLAACTMADSPVEDFNKVENPEGLHTCKLNLNVTKPRYADEPATRSAETWTNGDKIYITFTAGDETTSGDAVYADGEWTVSYYGTLTVGETSQCTAIYFENADYESGSVVMLTPNTAIYEDTAAGYLFDGTELSVNAALKPKTGRIRFAGTADETITLYGFTCFTSYNSSTASFTSSSLAISTTVEGESTPYIYGIFTDAEQPRINMITQASGFTRLPSKAIFTAGESGYMTIPTTEAHDGWQNSLLFKINGVEFNMIPVVAESSLYFIAETETTEAQYDAIIPTGTASQYPQGGFSYSDGNTYVSQLKTLTGLAFRIPTYQEWTYAAKGGNKSNDFIYAGSDNLSEVAWYKENSGEEKHEVKKLLPNELGLYDMNGNVWEVVTNGNYCGGSCTSTSSYCALDNYYSVSSTINAGLRLAL